MSGNFLQYKERKKQIIIKSETLSYYLGFVKRASGWRKCLVNLQALLYSYDKERTGIGFAWKNLRMASLTGH